MGNNVIDVKFAKQNECLPLIFKSVGPKGGDGKSAYEQALEGGYTGTEEEFNNDLKSFSDLSIKAEEGAQLVVNAAQTAQDAAQTAQSAQVAAAQSAQEAAQSASVINPNAYLKKEGDTMTGPLVIPEDVSIDFTDSTGKTCKISKNNKNLSALCEGKGVYLDSNNENLPGYTDGSKGYPVLVGGKNTKDYIVESYSDVEGNWYEVYASGKIRQGGNIIGNNSYGLVDVTFLKPFKDTNYSFSSSIRWGSSDWYTADFTVSAKLATDIVGMGCDFTVTGCKVQSNITKVWLAEGQGA